MSEAKRLGRPPDSSSEETRSRILEAARVCFATFGFEGTTNRQLADAARLTTGAIYHYFGSKQDLYVETHTQVQRIVYDRFSKATERAEPTFVAGITAVLDEALALQREDPSLASFLVSVRTDLTRHPELSAEERLQPRRGWGFFGDLIDRGVATGELASTDEPVVFDVITAMMMGLVTASSGDPDTHARAIEGLKRLVTGTLIDVGEASSDDVS